MLITTFWYEFPPEKVRKERASCGRLRRTILDSATAEENHTMEFGLSIAFSDPAHYIPLARAAEENGFDAVTLADHLIYPATCGRRAPL